MSTYQGLKGEYLRLLASVQLTRPDAAMAAARKVFANGNRYIAAGQAMSVPWPLIGALDLREDDCDPHASLGQGDPWNQVSTHVPRGKGPFSSWVDAAKYYIHYDGLDDPPAAWDMSVACWMGEKWNGFGPRNHGINTGYLWAGTNHYTRGKYVSDGVWSSSTVDQQIGIIPILWQMVIIDPETYIGTTPIPPSPDPSPVVPLPGPFTLAGTKWIQAMLDVMMPAEDDMLRIDGNYGRRTIIAVKNFQARVSLPMDGMAGPETLAAMDRELLKYRGV